MSFLVLAERNGREGALDADGTWNAELKHAELFATEAEALAVARRFGGTVAEEARVMPFDDCDEDEEE